MILELLYFVAIFFFFFDRHSAFNISNCSVQGGDAVGTIRPRRPRRPRRHQQDEWNTEVRDTGLLAP